MLLKMVACVVLSACSAAAYAQAPTKVIVDTDFVAPPQDDGMALLLAVKSPELHILGVTTVMGNDTVERATADALRVLEIAGRSDIPVYRGAAQPLRHRATDWARHAYGKWWSTDPPPPPPGGFARSKPAAGSAAEFIARTVDANPGAITVVAIGPLTNLATALQRDPSLASKIARVVIMGGAIAALPGGAGNMTPDAEFNIWVDPEAARLVFRSGVPITLTPLNATRQTRFTREWYDRIVAADTPVTRLIRDRVGPQFAADPGRAPQMFDQLAVAALIDPAIVRTVDLYVDVVDTPGPAYGVTVGGHKPWEGAEGAKRITVETEVDFERFIRLFVDRLTRP